MSEQREQLQETLKGSSNEPLGDVLKIILRHKSLVALGVVVALVLGAIYFAKATPIYRSSTDVLIVNKRPEVVAGGASNYFADYMSTHQALIVSPVIVNRAAERPEVAALKTKNIFSGLTVSASQNSGNILTVSFQGEEPEDCPIIVNAVLETYQSFLSETYDTMSTDTVKLMDEARDVLLADLKQQEEEYRKFRQDSPLLIMGEDGVHPAHSRLSTIQSQQSQLLMSSTELKSQLASIETAKAEGRDQDYMIGLITRSGLGFETENPSLQTLRMQNDKRASSNDLERMLLPLVQQESELLQQFGSNHPQLASLRVQINETRNYFARLQHELLISENRDEIVPLSIEYLQQELLRIATSQELLAALHDAEYEVAKELTDFELTEAEFQRNMSRTQQLYDGIIAQLQEANLSKDYGGFKADVISPAGFGDKVTPDAKTVSAKAIFFGLLLGVLLAYAADIADGSFRTPEEVGTQLGLPLVGQVRQSVAGTSVAGTSGAVAPELAGISLDPSLCAFYSPMSPETEAYRGLRTGLYFSNRGQNHSVIQVTSACPGDGKSTIAANLSVCIAQSGKRVLLVDADMRKPRQHEIFDVDLEHGLSTVIALDEELRDVVRETPIENLWLLPAGQLPPDPAELLTSSRFSELINLVREQYDYVIVDTGPLNVISDPCIVSSQVDGLLLTVHLAKTPRKEAERARDLLASLDAPVMGVVVNAVVSSGGRRYGYDSYRYGHYGNDHQSRSDVTAAMPVAVTIPARS